MDMNSDGTTANSKSKKVTFFSLECSKFLTVLHQKIKIKINQFCIRYYDCKPLPYIRKC